MSRALNGAGQEPQVGYYLQIVTPLSKGLDAPRTTRKEDCLHTQKKKQSKHAKYQIRPRAEGRDQGNQLLGIPC